VPPLTCDRHCLVTCPFLIRVTTLSGSTPYTRPINCLFCMRAKVNLNLFCKVFVGSGEQDQIIHLELNKTSVELCKIRGLPSQTLTLRLVRVNLGDEAEVLVTNLLDRQTHLADEFKALYYLRWGIEGNYKRLKQWVEIENFSGKSALSVKQDFYARILSTNLTAILANAAQRQVDKMLSNRKLPYQINFAQALSKMKNTVVQWLGLTPDMLRIRIEQFVNYIACTVESVRSGRSYNRPKTKKNRIFYSAYKELVKPYFGLNLTV
jgi:hypothetical protein